MNRCPYCAQPIKTERPFHIALSGRQLAVYETIAASGENGVTKEGLLDVMYGGRERSPPGGEIVLRVTVHGINKAIEPYHQRVIGRRKRGYFLVRGK